VELAKQINMEARNAFRGAALNLSHPHQRGGGGGGWWLTSRPRRFTLGGEKKQKMVYKSIINEQSAQTQYSVY